MTEKRTTSILGRVPVILAVTAASYGLPLQERPVRRSGTGSQATARGRVTPAQPANPRALSQH